MCSVYFVKADLICSIDIPMTFVEINVNLASSPTKWKIRWICVKLSPGARKAAGDELSIS